VANWHARQLDGIPKPAKWIIGAKAEQPAWDWAGVRAWRAWQLERAAAGKSDGTARKPAAADPFEGIPGADGHA